ncbi:hypothetical protein ACIPW9_00305 [Streptomyces sp. NPDC090052]|uniref:hypothetical protein n=1 Tax=unclassified Streptomyces TaxID=2593676 RepID=UPI0022579B42|nr:MULTISPECIES: hypothetical protein [unclassified Streptomyces]MCX4726398.1 hypothetical protein [Streptomyces sp. NBC_01306]WSV04277.1 hypothetical protein OG372_12175 [Streptomyces sp. NBC_01020]WSX42340.1 hypothetical protein OG760_11860 [Streptomyces sp. NBC_00963]WSX69608.1 hypothetical protein OG221_25045 [Streptomyces sp. NBC_00932]
MRLIPITLCAATAAAAALFPAAAIAAPAEGSSGTVTVSPSVIAPGEEVDLRVSCRSGKPFGRSDAFDSQAQFSPAADRGSMYAAARIRADAESKDYTVQVKCGRTVVTGTITVVREGGDHHRPMPLRTPIAPVHAGGGATATVAAQEAAPGTGHTVVGLVLAGIAAVAVAGRSVRRRRSS